MYQGQHRLHLKKTFQWSLPALRWDSAWLSGAPGCVFPEYLPTFDQLSRSSPTTGAVASQLAAVQARLGIKWGLQGQGPPLSFTTNAQLIQANVAEGCGGGVGRYASRCYQWPFAQTYQGASESGVSTTFDSPSWQVAAANAVWNSWAASEHLIDGDQFWVQIQP